MGCQSNDEIINSEHISLEEQNELLSKKVASIQPGMMLKKTETKKEPRTIEGIKETVQVSQYQILPYQVSYELDVFFGEPKVHQNEVIYVSENEQFEIKIKINERLSFDEIVDKLQDELLTKNSHNLSELQSLPVEENNINGKMQYTTDPIQGFYVYELNYYSLIIKYKYPAVGADGMGPLLKSLRKSITIN